MVCDCATHALLSHNSKSTHGGAGKNPRTSAAIAHVFSRKCRLGHIRYMVAPNQQCGTPFQQRGNMSWPSRNKCNTAAWGQSDWTGRSSVGPQTWYSCEIKLNFVFGCSVVRSCQCPEFCTLRGPTWEPHLAYLLDSGLGKFSQVMLLILVLFVIRAGHWKQFKASPEASGRVGESAANPNAATVPVNAVSARGLACPLAGKQASRNTKCPLTKKKYKQCCGKSTP